MPNNNINNELKQNLSETYNYTMGAAANAVSSLISANCQIYDSSVSDCSISELEYSEYDPAVIVRTSYSGALTGSSVMVFKLNDIQLMLNQLMGKPPVLSPDFRFDAINTSALSEIMNHMINASSLEFSKIIRATVTNSKPEIYTDSDVSIEKLLGLDPFDNVCVITSRLSIENAVNSKFITVTTPDMASAISQNDKNDESNTGRIDMNRQPESIMPPGSPFSASPNQPPVSFSSFQNTLSQEQLNNLQLLMNVPLELSIEIGSTQKKVDDILSFTQGTVLELDCPADAPVNVIVNGHLIARGDVVVVDDYFAVRITEILQSNLLDTLKDNSLK